MSGLVYICDVCRQLLQPSRTGRAEFARRQRRSDAMPEHSNCIAQWLEVPQNTLDVEVES